MSGPVLPKPIDAARVAMPFSLAGSRNIAVPTIWKLAGSRVLQLLGQELASGITARDFQRVACGECLLQFAVQLILNL
jgi:hypothetical protein